MSLSKENLPIRRVFLLCNPDQESTICSLSLSYCPELKQFPQRACYRLLDVPAESGKGDLLVCLEHPRFEMEPNGLIDALAKGAVLLSFRDRGQTATLFRWGERPVVVASDGNGAPMFFEHVQFSHALELAAA